VSEFFLIEHGNAAQQIAGLPPRTGDDDRLVLVSVSRGSIAGNWRRGLGLAPGCTGCRLDEVGLVRGKLSCRGGNWERRSKRCAGKNRKFHETRTSGG
jgi:hypothetical protein